jgi:YbgC/YbaW family acyl-CoA thioester hydrolase
MPFTTQITVRFGDCDPAGLVYYPVIFHYLHIAMEEFLGSVLRVGYNELMVSERIGFPTVKVQTQFQKPILYGDQVQITIGVTKVGRSSLTLQYDLARSSDKVLYATATLVHVAMNLDSRRSTEIPDRFREALMNSTG